MKINFRKIEEADIPFLCEVRNMYAEEFLHDSQKFSLIETLKWFNEKNPNYYIILVDNNLAGYFRLNNYSIKNKNIYIGADLHPQYCGKGIAYQSYMIFMKYLFEKYFLHKISLEVLSTNKKAIKLYKKIGFIEEGIKREEVLKKDIFIDSIIMSILKEEFYKK